MRNNRVLKFYTDPGHGWVKVSRKLINELGIADKISIFSYQRNNDVFLEEDCDAGVLIDALKARGITYKVDLHNSNKSSKIRSYERFRK